MVDYKKLTFKIQDDYKGFGCCFYYHAGTTIEDLLEYIINYFKEKKLCLCFQLYNMKNSNYSIIEPTTNFKDYISRNEPNFYLYNSKGNKCQCNEITKNNIIKSKKEIIKQLVDNVDILSNKEKKIEELKEEIAVLKHKNEENEKKNKEYEKLKKEIEILKQKNKENGNQNEIQPIENKNKEYEEKIQCLQNNIENLNKKIQDLEKIIHNNKIKSSENSLEKYDNISHRIITSKNYGNIKNIKAIYPQSISFKNKKVIGYHSPKNEIYNKSSSTINAHFLCNSNYNRMKNLTNNKKIKYHLKNDLNNLRKLKNDSITIIKIEKDENKSFSANKNINNNLERNRYDKYLYKTGNKIKTFNKILPPNPQYYSPLSCKSTYDYDTIVPKYIEKEMRKNILNNYAQNIINKSNKH